MSTTDSSVRVGRIRLWTFMICCHCICRLRRTDWCESGPNVHVICVQGCPRLYGRRWQKFCRQFFGWNMLKRHGHNGSYHQPCLHQAIWQQKGKGKALCSVWCTQAWANLDRPSPGAPCQPLQSLPARRRWAIARAGRHSGTTDIPSSRMCISIHAISKYLRKNSKSCWS